MEENRESFTSKLGFILACIGSAIGIGNIWGFPKLVSEYGGLTFIIPYLFFVILLASTGLIEEMSLGRLTKKGPVSSVGKIFKEKYNKGNLGKVLGSTSVFSALFLLIGYIVIVSWVLKYFYLALTNNLFSLGTNINNISSLFNDYTYGAFNNNLFIIILVIITFIIMLFGVSKGIEKANKIMMPVLFIIFLGLAIFIPFKLGINNSYSDLLCFKVNYLKVPMLWVYAFGQAFFSLSVTGNCLVVYGSYLGKDEDIVSSSKYVALFDTMVALLAAFVVIPSVKLIGNVDIATLSGPGLLFTSMVSSFNTLGNVGKIISVLFFLSVFFAGLSSVIAIVEVIVSCLLDETKINRKKATLFVIIIVGISSILVQGIVNDWMNSTTTVLNPLGAVVMAITFFYILDKDKALSSVNKGRKNKIGNWFYIIGKYIFVPLTFVALILNVIFNGIG